MHRLASTAERPGLPLLESAAMPPDEFHRRFLEENQPAMVREDEWNDTIV